ncbi:hypothetical protein ACFR97_10365 [Haloplanus litoreus]|uniref:Uncharacterized protein n=1 Tax=Haloplanus litoreus TaxID=767515 RepID=A0ABD6A2F7_9EURY
MPELQVGDVALDLTQGRPVHVLEDTGQTAAEWSDANDYDLCGNYGNSRLEAQPDDAVFEVVYCSNAKSEPSKTYAMPESRLLRIETEAADDGRPVAERAVVDVLEQLFDLAMQLDEDWNTEPEGFDDALSTLVINHSERLDTLGGEARELADVSHTVTGDVE